MPSKDLAWEFIFKGHALNLNLNTLRESLDSNAATCRLVSAKVLLVDAVHASEIVHVGKENGSL